MKRREARLTDAQQRRVRAVIHNLRDRYATATLMSKDTRIAASLISEVRGGGEPGVSRETARRAARALGVPVAELLGEV